MFLLVEDCPTTVKILKMQAARLNIPIHHVTTFPDALRQLDQYKYDAIILDNHLEEDLKTGIEMITSFRIKQNIKIFLVSADYNIDYKEAQVDRVFYKPLDLNLLLPSLIKN